MNEAGEDYKKDKEERRERREGDNGTEGINEKKKRVRAKDENKYFSSRD
jgi:hypothetical protein